MDEEEGGRLLEAMSKISAREGTPRIPPVRKTPASERELWKLFCLGERISNVYPDTLGRNLPGRTDERIGRNSSQMS